MHDFYNKNTACVRLRALLLNKSFSNSYKKEIALKVNRFHVRSTYSTNSIDNLGRKFKFFSGEVGILSLEYPTLYDLVYFYSLIHKTYLLMNHISY